MAGARLNRFIREGKARLGTRDTALAKSLGYTAGFDLEYLGTVEINEKSARKTMSNYYDVLRSVLEAIAALKGLKIYSHEAFTAFLKDAGKDSIAEKFDRFRRIRNGIEYFGNRADVTETKENIANMKILIGQLREELSRMLSEEFQETV